MQEVLVNTAVLALFVFLFAAISWMRKDNRLRLWTAGWLCILAHFAAELWQPSSSHWQSVQACINIDALALAGILFAVSSMILTEGGVSALRLGVTLAVTTLACLNLAVVALPVFWPLAAVVAARQLIAVSLAARWRTNRPAFGSIIGAICLSTGAWMLYGIFHGNPEIVIYALMGELFTVTAVDFWSSGWERSVGLKAMVAGLVAWGAVFPTAFWIQQLWPHLNVYSEIWNIPKFCVAVGMILVVLEEDTRSARALSEDYRLLFENNPHAMWITDVATLRLVAVNQVALNMHGYTREEFLRMKLTDLLHPDMHELALAQVRSAKAQPNRVSRHIRKNGTVLPMDLSASDIAFQGRRSRFIMALDVTEREALQQQLDQKAGHDQLTGLPNRVLFPDLLAAAVQHSIKTNEMLAVLSLDIDRFKHVNDVYGLRVGDEAIQRIAAKLTSGLRSMDIVARTGGDEFTIVLTGIKNTVAEQTVKELLKALGQPLIVQGYKLQLSATIGLAICPDDGTEAIALWRGAESARSEAKAAGGGTAVWLSPELSDAAEEQIELEAYMRSHIHDGGFHLVYQPIYNLDGEVRGLEALLRLNHPTYGQVSPATLIPIAEQTGLIVPLGDWVIEETCRQLLIWKSQGVPLVPIAINVSGLQLMHVDFARRILDTLQRYAIDPHWIHLEVTESAAMRNLGEVADQMAALSAQGIAFSIDDFGTGHSSLGRLYQLRISVLKIDRSFVERLCAENSADSIVQAIITLAHTLGHAVVAEGVETEQQLACLRTLGCDLLQGFLFARPVSPNQIPMLIAAVHPALDQHGILDCGKIHVMPIQTGTHGLEL